PHERLRARFWQLVDDFDLAFLRDDPQVPRLPWQSYIRLNGRFADWLRSHSLPFDFETVLLLKEHPAAQDLYLLQARKSYLAHRRGGLESVIPVLGPGGLREQMGTATQSERKFKQQLRQWQKEVQKRWLSCPNELTGDGNYLRIRPALAVSSRA